MPQTQMKVNSHEDERSDLSERNPVNQTPREFLEDAGRLLEQEIRELGVMGAGCNTAAFRKALDLYIDQRCTLIIGNSEWNGANLVRIGGVK